MRAALLLLVLGGCSVDMGEGGGGQGRSQQRVDPVTVVEVADAAVGGVSDLLVTNATVESERQADIIPQATGIVRELRVAEGDAVQSGQVLAILENVSLSEGSVRARAELDRLQRDLDATRRLFEQGAVSRSEVDALEGQVRGARSSLREANTQAGNTRLVAPFDGFVASRTARLGQLAPSGQPAMQVVDLDALRVVASLPERDVGRVAVGQSAELVSAYDSELTSAATIDRVAPVIDSQTGTFQVVLALPADQRALRPGQYVTVNLEVARHEGVVVVPKQAVIYEDGAPVVYRLADAPEPTEEDKAASAGEAAGQGSGGFGFDFDFGGGGDAAEEADSEPPNVSPFVAERIAIELGLVDGVAAEIITGISPGDRVIVIGQSNLRDGAPVKTPEMIREEAAKEGEAGLDTDAGGAG